MTEQLPSWPTTPLAHGCVVRLRDLSAGRATAGYAIFPLHRGRGIATCALQALTAFAWTMPALCRVDMLLYATTRPERQSKGQNST